MARAGANSGSFYHFFDSKDALLRAVLETYLDLLTPHVVEPAFKRATDPVARIFALLDGYRQRLLDTDCRYGCPIGRLALEIDPENVPAHQAIERNFGAWRAAVGGCLRAAGLPHPREGATLTLAVMEGAVMQARAARDITPYDESVQQLRACFAAMRPRVPARRRPARRR